VGEIDRRGDEGVGVIDEVLRIVATDGNDQVEPVAANER
jgi:hypothetical protein